MAILEKLVELGFKMPEQVNNSKGVTTVRVRTSKGWVYQRFSSDDQVESWAKFHKPEEEE